MSEPSTEELLEILRGRGIAVTPSLSGIPSVQAWLNEHNIQPGFVTGVVSSVITQHYKEWCKEQGHKPLHHTHMLHYLSKLGFVKTRVQRRGKDMRPYMLAYHTAAYFRAWEERNAPEVLPSSTKRNVDKAIEALKVLGVGVKK